MTRRSSKQGRFSLREIRVTQHGFEYSTFEVCGWIDGRRVRKRFKDRDAALGEKNRLEVEAANVGELMVRPTRLSAEQLADAEVALGRLNGKSLSAAVEWFLSTYRPPVAEVAFQDAKTAFLADRIPHVRPMTLRDYTRTLTDFGEAAAPTQVHGVKTAEVIAFLTSRGVGKKRWNNLRGDLSAFFEWCRHPVRGWCVENPVAAVPKFRIDRGVPHILTAAAATDLMAYVEEFEGGKLAPYFALALFAGLRPSIVEGEIWRISQSPDPARIIDLSVGVIRLGPDVSKVKSVRQVAIRPNLRKWLEAYPLKAFPLWVPGMKPLVTEVRRKFALGDDVLRHTWISMHVAKFKSLGAAALEAGNSETIIRRHYLNLVSTSDAASFWSIAPRASRCPRARVRTAPLHSCRGAGCLNVETLSEVP